MKLLLLNKDTVPAAAGAGAPHPALKHVAAQRGSLDDSR